jgi:hypothetical protein
MFPEPEPTVTVIVLVELEPDHPAGNIQAYVTSGSLSTL